MYRILKVGKPDGKNLKRPPWLTRHILVRNSKWIRLLYMLAGE